MHSPRRAQIIDLIDFLLPAGRLDQRTRCFVFGCADGWARIVPGADFIIISLSDARPNASRFDVERARVTFVFGIIVECNKFRRQIFYVKPKCFCDT